MIHIQTITYKICFIVVCVCSVISGCTRSSELEWNSEDGYRWTEVDPGWFGETGFDSLSPSRTNIHFENQITEEEITENQHYLNGSGVAAGDIDGDGLVDLYFAGLKGPNTLYKNLGNMKFRDITEESGTAHEGYYSTGTVFADIDGDGDLDLLITAMHKENVLYINDGSGKFIRKDDSGLGPAKGSMTMDLADIDGDGDLDLYVTNYKEKTIKDIYTAAELEWENILNEPYNEQNQTGPFTLVPPFDEHYKIFMTPDNRLAGVAETGAYDELYLNEGGTFRKVEDTEKVFVDENGEPLGLQRDWGLTGKFQDLNNDGYPDLYVCNDFFPEDRIWINQGDGTFRALSWKAMRNMSFAAMAGDFSDINRDGKVDLAVTQNNAETKLYLNRTEKSGYRVTLSGPDVNKNGIGSVICLVYSDGEKGPVREVQSGSGYWSQNSFAQVLGMKEGKEVSGIEVRWFDGLRQTVNVSGEPEEVLIEYSR